MRSRSIGRALRLSLCSVATALALLIAFLVFVDGRSTLAQGSVRYVKTNGVTNGSCNTWASACTLDYALSQATAGAELWLMAGVYTPTIGVGSSASFTLTSGVAIYGGFSGGEGARTQRNANPATNNTVLSGNVGAPGLFSDNAIHVVTAVNVDAATVLDGVTIAGGNANGVGTAGYGGGMYISSGNLTIANVIFTGNAANYYGGGLYSRNSSPILQNVQFIANTANYGGGIYNYNTIMTLTGVAFVNNGASLSGGGMNNSGSTPIMNNVLFQGNTASLYGGGLYNSTSFPRITAGQFISNAATSYGGAIYLSRNELDISDSVFMNNTSRTAGGGVYTTRAGFKGARLSLLNNSARYNGGAVFTDRSGVTLTHVTAAYNTAKYGGAFYNDTSTAVITNATFYSNVVTVDGGAIFNDAAPLTLVHLTAMGNAAEHYGGVIYSILDAPIVRNAILWGNNAEKGAAIIGTATFVDAIVEGGCPVGVSCTGVRNADPILGAPGNYGGAVNTIPILTGSPAIDQVTAFCHATDARSVARPQGARCDLGAYESRGFTLTVVSGNNQAVEVYQPYPAPLVVSASSREGHAVDGAQVTFTAAASGKGTTPASQTTTVVGGLASATVAANGYPGEYTVAVSAPGSSPISFSLDNIDTPVAGLQAAHSGATPVGHAVVFTASVQGGTSIVYNWQFGDGAVASTTGITLAHAYALAGSYVVTVTASNEVASARLSLPLTIYDVALAGLQVIADGPTALGQPTHFQATTRAGTGLAYTWDFGDGGASAGAAPVHTYAAPGVYTATVNATNGVSSASAQSTILVEQALSGVDLLPHGTIIGEVGRAVSFSINIGAGEPTHVAWSFGDEQVRSAGAMAAAAGDAPWTSIEHVYAAPGAYQVTAHVANSVSQFDVTNVVEIRDVPISGASIVWSGEAEEEKPLEFSAHKLEGTSVNCIWDFDDSTPPVTGCDVEHIYRTAGQYTVKVWMVNSVGVVVTRSLLTIVAPPPDPPEPGTTQFLYLPTVTR